tara:strand:+ start:600 stop:1064 length:465 start_codon:yes stop_codon:yes gene_type:complete
MIDITKYINREQLLFDTLKNRLLNIGDSDAQWVYDTCFPMDQDILKKDGKTYVEEPDEGIDSMNLMEEIVDVVDEVKERIDNLFSFLNELELDSFDTDLNNEFIWTNDFWYKEFKKGNWGELLQKTQADPDYKSWHLKKLVERDIKQSEEYNNG